MSNAYIEALGTLRVLQNPLPPVSRNQALALIVPDTNVLMDMWVFENPASVKLLQMIRSGQIQAARSRETVEEFADVLSRPAFSLPVSQQERILREWLALSIDSPVPQTPSCVFCRDPDDRKFIALALEGRAAMLVSRDKAVLKAGRKAKKQGLAIVSPEEALLRLAEFRTGC
jgi:putative PIN family toxin of toxin-antitoxin system